MLRLLLILILIGYILYKLGFFRIFLYHFHQGYHRQDREPKIHFRRKEPRKSSFKGGEYVDFEEVE